MYKAVTPGLCCCSGIDENDQQRPNKLFGISKKTTFPSGEEIGVFGNFQFQQDDETAE